MTEYYENGPEGMPRVERMTRNTIMAVLSQKNVPTIYVSREEDYNSLCKFAHAVAEETLARVPAWPKHSLSAQDEVLTDDQIDAHINTVLRPTGTKMANFTMQKSKDDLRTAMRSVLAAATLSPSLAVRDVVDAARYRFLRDGANNGYHLKGETNIGKFHVTQKIRDGEGLFYHEEFLDAAIDAAMREQQP